MSENNEGTRQSHLSSRDYESSLCILQSRFVVGQLEKLRVKVSRALTFVVEHELVITTVCTYHCIRDRKRERLIEVYNDFRLNHILLIHKALTYDAIVILTKRAHALGTTRHLKFAETPTGAKVLWQERGGR